MSVSDSDFPAHRRSKYLVLLSLALVLAAVWVVLQTPPADGYEISIYDAYPAYFWAFVVGAILVGQVAILRGARRRVSDPYWRLAFAAILVVDVLILLLPEFRGYPIYGRADVLTHVGFAKNIMTTGTIPSSNIYPNLHVLFVSLSYATGLDLLSVVAIVPPAVSLLSIVSTYLLLRRTFDDMDVILFGLAFVSFLSYQTAHVNVSPYAQSALLVPFVLYLAISERQARTLRTKIPLVIVLLAIVTYHPLTSVFLLLVFFIAISFQQVALTDTFNEITVNSSTLRGLVSGNAATIILVTFITWYHHFAGTIFRLQSVFETLTRSGGEGSTLESYSSTVQETSPRLVDLLEIAVFKYGYEVVVIGLAAQYGMVILYRFWRRREYNHYQSIFVGTCGVFTLFAAVSFVNNFMFGFGRPLQFAKLFALLLIGPLFAFLFEQINRDRLQVGLRWALYGTLVVLVVVSVFATYFSPLVSQTNHQVSEMDLEGADWILEHRNENVLIDEFQFGQTRFADAFYGQKATRPGLRDRGTVPPPHFNYTEYETVGRSYENDTYFVLTQKGRMSYPKKFPNYRRFWRYTPKDFARIDRDTTTNQIYTNGEFEVYLIDGSRRPSSTTIQDSNTTSSDLSSLRRNLA